MKILIADDEKAIVSLTKQMLTTGNDIIVANDGLEALAKASETNPDLIISDTFMPGLNGPEWIDRYIHQNKNPQPRIIILSGNPVEFVVEKYPAVLKYTFLKKPFLYSEFQQAISEACRQTS